jgi:hypothetical protein
MKIDKILIAADGVHNMNYPYKETEIKDGKEISVNKTRDLTYRDVFVSSLLSPVQSVNQKGVVTDDDYKTKLEKYKLFVKIRDSKEEVELNTKEIQILKTAIGKKQAPLILGQCDEFLS